MIQGSVLAAAVGLLALLGIIGCIKGKVPFTARTSAPVPPPYARRSRQNPEDGPPLPVYKECPDQSDRVLERYAYNLIYLIVLS